MDPGADERARAPLHAGLKPGPRRGHPRAGGALLLLAAAVLLAGLAGGLLRAGVGGLPAVAWLGQAAAVHAALLIGGFFGTAIGVERAVALGGRWAFAAPLASALGALALLGGAALVGQGLLLLAAAAFLLVNVQLVQRQRAPHTLLLLAGALAWAAGNLVFAGGGALPAVHALWFAFLVVTIAAERLEMTRLLRHAPGAQRALLAIVGGLLGAAALCVLDARAGGVLYGLALVLLALWLGRFDIARRTVHARGLSRFMAVCLLGGYAWLALAGAAWAATALGWPARDAALHALGLGFVLSMVMGHAPVILPAVARVKLRWGAQFYLPLALLHASLLLRLLPGAFDASLRALGAALNAASLLLYLVTLGVAALAARR